MLDLMNCRDLCISSVVLSLLYHHMCIYIYTHILILTYPSVLQCSMSSDKASNNYKFWNKAQSCYSEIHVDDCIKNKTPSYYLSPVPKFIAIYVHMYNLDI